MSFSCQVDHERRDGLEHKVERELVSKSSGNSTPTTKTPSATTAVTSAMHDAEEGIELR